MKKIFIVLFAALVISSPLTADEASDKQELKDALTVLEKAKVPTTGKDLLTWLKKRIPTEGASKRAEELISKLSHESYQAREQAEKDLMALGEAARPALQQALKSKEPEVVRRARACLDKLKSTQKSEIEAAAALVLCKQLPNKAAGLLITFLPMASTPSLKEELTLRLFQVTKQNGRIAPEVIKALSSELLSQRKAAALIVGRFGDKTAQEKVKELAQKDADASARLQACKGLIMAADPSALPWTIELLTETPKLVGLEAMDVLQEVAAGTGPVKILPEEAEDRAAAQKKWQDWWASNKGKLELDQKKLTSLMLSPSMSAQRALDQFLNLATRGKKTDVKALQELIGFPFEIAGFQVFENWESVKGLFNSSTEAPKMKWTTPQFVPVKDYWTAVPHGFPETMQNKTKARFDKIPVSQLRAVRIIFSYKEVPGKENQTSHVLLRRYGTKFKIVGIR